MNAVGVLLDAANRAQRSEPECPLAGQDPADLYRAGVAATLRIIVLQLAEKYELLPAHRRISALHRAASVPPLVPPSFNVKEQSAPYLWRRAMEAYASLGQRGELGVVPEAGSGDTHSSWSNLVDVLPIDAATFLRTLDLLSLHEEPEGSDEAADAEIEQIGATYEWLCGFTARRAPDTLVRLKGRVVAPRIIPLVELERRLARNPDLLIDYVTEQTGRKRSAVARDLRRMNRPEHTLPAGGYRDARTLSSRLQPFADLLEVEATGSSVFQTGDLYLTPTADRRRNGTHYTARWMIEQLVRHTLDPLVHVNKTPLHTPQLPNRLKRAEEILQLRICDIAMGCGGFVLEACRYLADCLLDAPRHTGSIDRVGSGEGEEMVALEDTPTTLSIQQARRLVADHCVHGVDIDPLAVELARASLWLFIADDDITPAAIGRRLRCGDSLVGLPLRPPGRQQPSASIDHMGQESRHCEMADEVALKSEDSLYGTRPFHWTAEFPEILVISHGFDAIMGNPPFGNAIEAATARDPVFGRYARTAFEDFARGASDLCLLFWGRALLYLLKPCGRYGWISPTTLLSDHKPWRDWVHDRARPDVLIRFPVRAFPQARIRTTGICGALGQAPHVLVIDHDCQSAPKVACVAWTDDLHNWHEACERAFTPSTGVMGSTTTCHLRSLPLDLFAGSTAATAYILQPYISDERETGGQCLVTTGALDRYSCSWGRKPVRYLKRDYAAPRWPESSHIPIDVARARDRQQGTKIIIGGLTAVIEAWLDETGAAAGTVSTWIIRHHPDLAAETTFALLAILNSATFSRIYMGRHGAKAMSGKQTTIQKQALLEMPVPLALLSSPPALFAGTSLAGAEVGTQLTVCMRVGRLLQRVPGDSPLWPQLDKLGHVAAGLLYGQSLDATLADYDWWCDRVGRRAELTPVHELAGLLIMTERNEYGRGCTGFASGCES